MENLCARHKNGFFHLWHLRKPLIILRDAIDTSVICTSLPRDSTVLKALFVVSWASVSGLVANWYQENWIYLSAEGASCSVLVWLLLEPRQETEKWQWVEATDGRVAPQVKPLSLLGSLLVQCLASAEWSHALNRQLHGLWMILCWLFSPVYVSHEEWVGWGKEKLFSLHVHVANKGSVQWDLLLSDHKQLVSLVA